MSNRSALELWTMIRPSTSEDPPKYSATTAPIRLSVVASLSAVKKNGSAFGSRTLRRIVALGRGVRAHELQGSRLHLRRDRG